MPLGILGKLGAVGSGLQDAIPKLIENDEKQLNAEFMSNFHRVAVSEDPMQLQQLMQDPRFSRVTPEVRQRAMQIAERVLARKATAADRERAHSFNLEKEIANRQAQIHKLGAEGYNVTQTPSDEFGLPQITGLERGPELQKAWEAKQEQFGATLEGTRAGTEMKRQQALVLKDKLKDINREQADIDRAFRAALINPSVLKNARPEVREKVAIMLAEVGAPMGDERKRRIPQAFIRQNAEYRSAIGELERLTKTLEDNRDITGPIDNVLARIFSPARRADVEAHIALVKQRIGKALEGGVLRKEDEEKYKRILATIWDFDKTSISKIKNLIMTLREDQRILAEEWKKVSQAASANNVTEEDDIERYMEFAIRHGIVNPDTFPFDDLQ
jgi:hypothetical protein